MVTGRGSTWRLYRPPCLLASQFCQAGRLCVQPRKSFGMRTYEKRTRKSFRMHSYEIIGLKTLWNEQLQKYGGWGAWLACVKTPT